MADDSTPPIIPDALPTQPDPESDGPSGGSSAVLDRREVLDHLLKLGAASLVAALAAGASLAPLVAAAKGSETKQKYRYGMVIDTRRCVG